MPGPASELARRLAHEAEAVCRYYLSNGRRHGRYWCVGDVDNTPGDSLYVMLDDRDGRAGKWTDAATGEHGDLLDLISANRGLHGLHDAMLEARQFLRLHPEQQRSPGCLAERDVNQIVARRLFASALPIQSTLAQRYLDGRGLALPHDGVSLRFLAACRLRNGADEPDAHWPALLAAATDNAGEVRGIQRTYLARGGMAKAPVAKPRRSLGSITGHAVRFSPGSDVLAVGEGVETVLSLRPIMPRLPVAAALSAYHLSQFVLPPELRFLYVLMDDDAAGRRASDILLVRASEAGIGVRRIVPIGADLNDDLRETDIADLVPIIRSVFRAEDLRRFG